MGGRLKYRANEAVLETSEFRRIASLPWRTWTEDEAQQAAEHWTRELKTRRGTWSLKPIQGVALDDTFTVGGLFASIGVGRGKTLISLLAGTVLEAVRPVLLVKPDLYAKTMKDIREMSEHFAVHPNLRVIAYSQLSSPKFSTELQDYEPDLVIADEGQCLKNMQTARTRKFLRAMKELETHGSRARFVCMSGTFMRRSLHDYWHLMNLALADGNSCLPYSYAQLVMWAAAIDEKVPEFARPSPGCLLNFLPDDADTSAAGDDADLARMAYCNRFRSTAGVVASGGDEQDVNASLIVSELEVDTPDSVKTALADLRENWITPAGDELQYTLELWSHARQLASGMFYRFDPPPPPEWAVARKDWRIFVREQLSLGRAGLDSPMQVAMAYPEHPALMRWREVRGIYNPAANSVGVWIDEYLVNAAADWLESGPKDEGRIAWVEHNEFGQRLAEVTGRRYFAGGKRDHEEILSVTGPIIASIKCHGVGKNLQDRYWNSLVTSCPPAGDVWEQLLGRTHRTGTDNFTDEVNYRVFLPCQEMRDGMRTALADARLIFHAKGMSQKLLIADLALGELEAEDSSTDRAVRGLRSAMSFSAG